MTISPTDRRVLLIVLALIIVTSVLDPGLLRSYLEVYLVLSIIPGFLTAIRIFELLGSGIDLGSWMFYIRLIWICSTAYLTGIIYSWIFQAWKLRAK